MGIHKVCTSLKRPLQDGRSRSSGPLRHRTGLALPLRYSAPSPSRCSSAAACLNRHAGIRLLKRMSISLYDSPLVSGTVNQTSTVNRDASPQKKKPARYFQRESIRVLLAAYRFWRPIRRTGPKASGARCSSGHQFTVLDSVERLTNTTPLHDCRTAAIPAVCVRSMGVESSTKQSQPAPLVSTRAWKPLG